MAPWQVLPVSVATTVAAPTQTESALTAGLSRYRSGDMLGAIQHWQKLVVNTSTRQTLTPEQVTALKYLTKAYAQVGQLNAAIASLKPLIHFYRQQGNDQERGRLLTEQAQLLSQLGQQDAAIAILCGTVENGLEQTDQEKDRICQADSAVAIARRVGDAPGEAAALGSLGNVYRLQGEYEQAIALLKKSLAIAEKTSHPAYQMAATTGLGNAYTNLAQRTYRQLHYIQQSDHPRLVTTQTQRANQYNREAIRYLQTSLQLAHEQNDLVNQLRVLLNLVLPVHREVGDRGLGVGDRGSERSPREILKQAMELLERLPDSREKVFAAIRLATLRPLLDLPAAETEVELTARCVGTEMDAVSLGLLRQAIAIGQRINDPQAVSLAMGRLGHRYECAREYAQALNLTQQAELLDSSPETRYLWEWQAGRILRSQDRMPQAMASYEMAVKTLNGIRSNLAIANRGFQFDFRDTVEPVYRELTELYLNQAEGRQREDFGVASTMSSAESSAQLSARAQAEGSNEGRQTVEGRGQRVEGDASLVKSVVRGTKDGGQRPKDANISAALQTIDSLRLAEVQNYLGDDCSLPVLAKPVTLIDQKTAVISTIMVGDRVAVIATLAQPGGGLQSQLHWIPASQATVIQTVNTLRRQLEKRSDLTNQYLTEAQMLYDWLIRPFQTTLQQSTIETLVFIQDGLLRSIPMAALHDGQQFLVEQYATASTLSLTLVDPVKLNRAALRVLALGITKPSAVAGPTYFAPLNYVQSEITRIKQLFPGSEGILDEEFTRDRLRQELTQKNFPIVHLSTHGKFGIDSRDTFLVTGQPEREPASQVGGKSPASYNEKLTINQLYQILRHLKRGNTVELLTLTACETAAGSDREALGIAGISLQAGARSAVASLWQVDDQSTAQLITQFYQNLHQGMSRAKALQAAQKTWLKGHPNSHPGYWAALILVGNWL